MSKLIRFWFTFENSPILPSVIKIGCGITAYDFDDALTLLHQAICPNGEGIIIKKCIENIDLTTLDQKHVLPNILPPNFRGIWYPLGYN